MSEQVSDKRLYEVIDDNEVVITTYGDEFLVMNCDVQGEMLQIKKGEYYFIEMTGVDIKYHEYEKVKCE